jgi:hypothetical protein
MLKGNDSLDNTSDACLGQAMAAEWRRRYPQNTIGHIQQDLDVSRKAAESLLAGQFSSTSLGRIILAYGPGWVAERVMEAAGTNLEQYIEKQVAEAERAAALAKEKARNARERLAKYQAAVRSRADLDSQADDRGV